MIDRPMGAIKFRVTKIDEEFFFLKEGSNVIVDYNNNRVYSEDGKSYMPLKMALEHGLNGEIVQEKVSKPNELKETIELMTSSDYKERFRAEYWQLVIRYTGLKKMLEKWRAGILEFDPTCPKCMYDEQIRVMRAYIRILERRALKENIQLW